MKAVEAELPVNTAKPAHQRQQGAHCAAFSSQAWLPVSLHSPPETWVIDPRWKHKLPFKALSCVTHNLWSLSQRQTCHPPSLSLHPSRPGTSLLRSSATADSMSSSLRLWDPHSRAKCVIGLFPQLPPQHVSEDTLLSVRGFSLSCIQLGGGLHEGGSLSLLPFPSSAPSAARQKPGRQSSLPSSAHRTAPRPPGL